MAQRISPADLLQMDKLFQMNDPHCDRYTFEYLSNVDRNWMPSGKPTVDQKGYSSIIYYTSESKNWVRPESNSILLSVERGTLKKAIIYSFDNLSLWNEYQHQMEMMNADKLGSGPQDGGVQTIYTVNDIVFILSDYPPGINGSNRSFSVGIMRDKK